jgi:thioredoxin reductase (NADPH)
MTDLIVVGAGVAGLSAAMYAGRLGIETVLVEQLGGGGQLMNAGPIETYPGLPGDTIGPDFVSRLTEQVLDFDVEMEFDTASRITRSDSAFVVECAENSFSGRAVIVATGSRARRLGVPGEEALTGRGMSDCAICDGGFFAGETVAMVGGGDRAAEGALHLVQNKSPVNLIHREPELRAVEHLRRRLRSGPGITMHSGATVQEILGTDRVEGIRIRVGNDVRQLDVRAVFVNIGMEPCTEIVADLAELDGEGRVLVDLGMRTSVQGLFAAGSVRAGTADQLVTAAGDGVTAAFSAAEWLERVGDS